MKVEARQPTYQATHSIDVFGHKEATKLCYLMILGSVFFVVEPLPDNFYRFFVKEEYIPYLENTLKVVKQLISVEKEKENHEHDGSSAES